MKKNMKNKMKTKTKILVFIFKFYYGTSRPPQRCKFEIKKLTTQNRRALVSFVLSQTYSYSYQLFAIYLSSLTIIVNREVGEGGLKILEKIWWRGSENFDFGGGE